MKWTWTRTILLIALGLAVAAPLLAYLDLPCPWLPNRPRPHRPAARDDTIYPRRWDIPPTWPYCSIPGPACRPASTDPRDPYFSLIHGLDRSAQETMSGTEVPPALPVKMGNRVRTSWPTPEPAALPRD